MLGYPRTYFCLMRGIGRGYDYGMDLSEYSVPGSRLSVTDVDGLELIEMLTHDEYFEYEDIVFDSEMRQLRIPFRRIFHGNTDSKEDPGVLNTTTEVPVLRCCLLVEGVTKVTLAPWKGICSFADWAYDAHLGKLTISFWMGLTAVISVSNLSITYEAIEFRGKGRISRGSLGVEVTDGKVY